MLRLGAVASGGRNKYLVVQGISNHLMRVGVCSSEEDREPRREVSLGGVAVMVGGGCDLPAPGGKVTFGVVYQMTTCAGPAVA